jgi:hypothetical protein
MPGHRHARSNQWEIAPTRIVAAVIRAVTADSDGTDARLAQSLLPIDHEMFRYSPIISGISNWICIVELLHQFHTAFRRRAAAKGVSATFVGTAPI